MFNLIPHLVILGLAAAQAGLAAPEDAVNTPARRWVSSPAQGQYDNAGAYHVKRDNHPDVRRRQGSASITAPATAASAASSYVTGAYEEPPSLAPVRSDFMESLSKLDSSLDAEVNPVISQMTTAQCSGVPDINGKPVTICGPTAASAAPGAASSTDDAAARGGGMALGGIVLGLAGALLL